MASLADLAAYKLRHGAVAQADENSVTQLLADASSLVREVAHLQIDQATSTVTVDGDGTRRVFLPEIPVTAVSALSVEGVALDPSTYRWWEWGGLDRRDGVWPCEPRAISITYTHGWAPVPDWIVNMVCSMVFESLRDQVISGEQSITTGSQTISYFTARSNLYLPSADVDRLRALKGPVQ